MIPWIPTPVDETLIDLALREDLGFPFYDATTATLLEKKEAWGKAEIVSKHLSPIVVCGTVLLPLIAQKWNQSWKIEYFVREGDWLLPGQTLLSLEAPIEMLLALERTVLNFLRHLSAVATLTRSFTERIQHTSCKILDTRKTTPGWRHLEKYAVSCGGGVNHRQGLYDAIMIKDTHIDLLGGLEKTLQSLSKRPKTLPVIVEVRDRCELDIALEYANLVDRILIDNVRPPELTHLVKACEGILPTEASGNLTLETISAVAESGVYFASVGCLTHSAGQVDLSMKIQ